MIRLVVDRMPLFNEECPFSKEPPICSFSDDVCSITKCKFLTAFEDRDETSKDKVTRPHWIDIWENNSSTEAQCSACKRYSDRPVGRFCKWCGVKMLDEEDGCKLNSEGIIRKAIGEDI